MRREIWAFFGFDFALGQILEWVRESQSLFVATFAFVWILRLRALRSAQDDGDGGKG
jgi:hypothetical protein